MSNRHTEGPGNNEGADPRPIPRDPPDQQAAPDEDPWDAVGSTQEGVDERPDAQIPDTDEAGTARRGAPQHGRSPAHPAPDESTA